VFGRTGLDQEDITILHDVVLALGHDLTGSPDGRFVAVLPQRLIVEDDGLDEGLFKVGVDDTRCLRRLGALPDGPLPDLVRTGCEEAVQVQGLAHGHDDLWQGRLGAQPLAFLLRLSLAREPGQPLLERDGNGDDGVARGVFLDPLDDLGEVLVLLADVILLTEVDQVDDGLGRQKVEGVDNLDLVEQDCQHT